MHITFLGTGAGIPTLKRKLPSLVLFYEGENLMFDCGEGTQLQMIKAKIGLGRKMKIFITHLHGDHVLGVPGLIQTMSLLGRHDKLEVYGPEGLGDFINAARTHIKFNLRFPLKVEEVGEGVIIKDRKYKILAKIADHSIANLAYAFVENKKPGKFYPERALKLGIPKGPLWHRLQLGRKVKLADGRKIVPTQVTDEPRQGRKLVYSGDTKPCMNMLKLARKADLLIHECTFDDSLVEKAETEWHSAPSEVADLARKSEVKNLILTHISARYKNPKPIIDQAKKIFRNVTVAEDLMVYNLARAQS